jgi:lipopolysaccharide transport system ATP-binding protein
MQDVVISARGLDKSYRVFENQWSRLAHALWGARAPGTREVRALRSVSFDVARGESVAIIGRNGSGKSTLLQILAGTLTPTAGEFRVRGRVSALLELGSGFNPEYSGRDNAILNGLLLGLERAEIAARLGQIVDFAEIGDALDRPVKTYSSGMLARLAFAVQVALDPEVLIVDEALSVGDFFFQQKCAAHIRAMQARGVTILFVSHDMGMVRNVCSRAIYLRSGEVVFVGEADRAALLYFQEESKGEPPPDARPPGAPRESGADIAGYLWQVDAASAATPGPRILGVDIRNVHGERSLAHRIGDRLRVLVLVARPAPGCGPALMVKNAIGQVVNVTYFKDLPGATFAGHDRVLFTFDLELALEAGRYSFQVYASDATGANVGSIVSESPALGPISIEWDYEVDKAPFYGMFGIPAKVTAEVMLE